MKCIISWWYLFHNVIHVPCYWGEQLSSQYGFAGREGNFAKRVEGVSIDHLGTDYDYGSVMHYG